MITMREVFNLSYDTKYTIVERETGKQVNVNAIFITRSAAENCLKIIGEDKHDIALLITERRQ